MEIKSLNALKEFCSDCECLHDVLKQYTGCELWSEIKDCLNADDTLWSMADQNDIKEPTMSSWISDHLNSSVKCRVFQEHGPAGGWPVVKVECLDMIFFLDWVIE